MDNSLEEKIDALNELLIAEMGEWERLGVDPATAITINVFMLDSYVMALCMYLGELGVIDTQEFTLRFKVKMYENLQLHRVNVEKIIRQSKIIRPDNGRLIQ